MHNLTAPYAHLTKPHHTMPHHAMPHSTIPNHMYESYLKNQREQDLLKNLPRWLADDLGGQVYSESLVRRSASLAHNMT
jgi:hypothetical protein